MMHAKKSFSFSSVLTAALLLACMAAFFVQPTRYAACIQRGISLWAVSVLPATFPFLFLCALFSATPLFAFLSKKLSPVMGKLFRVSGEGGCIALLSALSGYPVGAKILGQLCERQAPSRNERFRLACLCSTSGPMFLVGVVGGVMFQSVAAGYLLLFCHLFSVYAILFIMRFFAKDYTESGARYVQPPTDLYTALLNAVLSILCVGGLIALFTAFGQMLADTGLISLLASLAPSHTATVEGVAQGLLEMTGGCALLAKTPSPFTLACACFLVTFGGACVLMQQLAFLRPAKINALAFVGVKLLQALLSFFLCLLLAPLVF